VRQKIEAGAGVLRFCFSEDGLLYEGQHLEHARLVVFEKLTRSIIEMHHDKVFADHQGVKRTRDLITLNYVWPHMDKEIEIYVRQCESCARLKGGRNPIVPLGE
jgi:hypothetical protein